MTVAATIVWFRRDLRLADNPALAAAVDAGGPVLPIYLVDWERGDRWAPGKAASWWLGHSLRRLASDLNRCGSALALIEGDPAEALVGAARGLGARQVVWNRLYEPHSRAQEERVKAALEKEGVGFRDFGAALLFDPEHHLSRAGRPYVQFGAFWRACLAVPEPASPGASPSRLRAVGEELSRRLEGASERIPFADSDPLPPTVVGSKAWQPGEMGAYDRLETFLEKGLAGYEQERDYPGREGISRLSPHLHFGEISPHQVWHAVRAAAPAGAAAAEASAAFLRQLGWREFAHYLLYHFPATVAEPFNPEFGRFPWADDPDGLAAWQHGRTGYPLVDAGMHQLLAEGWMHNRVRMVVASFLTKDLLIPWQQGAAWFWDNLVDADLANNTLGWQWTAGCGPDAAPYFRIYNPELQARRFDARGEYVGRWSQRPDGGPEDSQDAGGPSQLPIVEHAVARARALAAFRGLRSG